MKIKILKTMDGSPDGSHVLTYKEGETYDVPEGLAKVFLREKWGKAVMKRGPESNKNLNPKTETK